MLRLEKKGASCEIKLVRSATLSGRVTTSDGSPMQSVTVMVGNGGIGGGRWNVPKGDYDRRAVEEAQQAKIVEKLQRLKQVENLRNEIGLVEREVVGGSRRPASQLATGGSGYTGADGRYRIQGLKPGTSTVTVTYGNISTSRDITLKSGENFADFTLDTGNRVKLTGRDSGGNKVKLSSAWFRSAKGGYAKVNQLPVKTAGELEYIGFKEGTWTVNARASGFPAVTQEVTVRAGTNTFEILFQEPASLTGHVASSSGKVPKRLYVRLTPAGNDATPDRNSKRRRKASYRGGQTAVVDAKGNYKFPSVQPGEYRFSVQFNGNDELYSCELTLSPGKQTQDATIDERCTVRVTVSLAPDMKNDGKITVTLSQAGRDKSKGGYVSRYGKLDKNNQCEFSFLPEGEYYVMAYSSDGNRSYKTVTANYGINSVELSLGPPNCVQITQVVEGYQGAEAGLKVGDLVTRYNGVAINNMQDLVKQVQSTKAEDSVMMVVVRNGSTMSFRLNGGRIGINGNNHRR
jgi:protocatechuate 3,4-dioxygenase beta subunit